MQKAPFLSVISGGKKTTLSHPVQFISYDAQTMIHSFEITGPLYVSNQFSVIENPYLQEVAISNKLPVRQGKQSLSCHYFLGYEQLYDIQRYEFLSWLAAGRQYTQQLCFVQIYLRQLEFFLLCGEQFTDPDIYEQNLAPCMGELMSIMQMYLLHPEIYELSTKLYEAAMIKWFAERLDELYQCPPICLNVLKLRLAQYAQQQQAPRVDWLLQWALCKYEQTEISLVMLHYTELLQIFSVLYKQSPYSIMPCASDHLLVLKYELISNQGLVDIPVLPKISQLSCAYSSTQADPQLLTLLELALEELAISFV